MMIPAFGVLSGEKSLQGYNPIIDRVPGKLHRQARRAGC